MSDDSTAPLALATAKMSITKGLEGEMAAYERVHNWRPPGTRDRTEELEVFCRTRKPVFKDD